LPTLCRPRRQGRYRPCLALVVVRRFRPGDRGERAELGGETLGDEWPVSRARLHQQGFRQRGIEQRLGQQLIAVADRGPTQRALMTACEATPPTAPPTAVADRPDPLPANPIGEMADRNLARYLPGRISGKTPNTFLALFDLKSPAPLSIGTVET